MQTKLCFTCPNCKTTQQTFLMCDYINTERSCPSSRHVVHIILPRFEHLLQFANKAKCKIQKDDKFTASTDDVLAKRLIVCWVLLVATNDESVCQRCDKQQEHKPFQPGSKGQTDKNMCMLNLLTVCITCTAAHMYIVCRLQLSCYFFWSISSAALGQVCAAPHEHYTSPQEQITREIG